MQQILNKVGLSSHLKMCSKPNDNKATSKTNENRSFCSQLQTLEMYVVDVVLSA